MSAPVTRAWFARLEAKPGCEEQVEKLLAEQGLQVSLDDGCWWALRFGAGEHAIFTTLGPATIVDLGEQASLLDGDLTIDEVDVVACKLQPQRVATKALAMRLPVRSSGAADVSDALTSATKIVDRELETVAWFAVRYADGDLGVVSAFPDRHGRRAHLNGRFARDVGRRVFGLLDGFPAVEPADVIEQRRPERR